jgi:[ribosomal protein S5]-alanine N-acetyltransferase
MGRVPLVTVRRARAGDAEELSRLLERNAEHLAPYEPLREPGWTSVEEQRRLLATGERLTDDGLAFAGVIEVEGRIAGRVNLNQVVRGVFCSADLGYWVDSSVTRQGIATTAVRHVLILAFGPMELHRVQAGTLVHNVASQRVLARNGFERIGVARDYLRIAGRWQDHVLFQRLAGG